MKNNSFIDFLWSYLFLMVQLVYLLVEPLIFTTVGLIMNVRWPYYLVSIGGYYALTAIWELVARYLKTEDGKAFHSPFVSRLKKVMAQFSQNGEKPTKEDN